MDQAFSNIFKNSFLLGDALGQAHSLLENEDYFKIRCFKLDFFDKKRWALREAWPKQSDGREILKIAVGSNFSFKNWGHLQTFIKIPCTLEFLDPHFFMGEMSPREFSTKCNYLRGKIVLTTNHGFTASTRQPLINLINFYLKCTQSLFAGWDWDNHHNINISSIYAMCSDIYFPSQRGYDYELSRVAPNIRFIIPSTYEWPNDFLESNIDTIVNPERRINIFGAFNYYGKFSHRNRIIA